MIYTWDNKKPAENLIFSFDLTNEISTGEFIETVTAAISIKSGTDPNVATMLSGNPGYSGNTVFQNVQGGVDGVYYYLAFTVVTNLQTNEEIGIIPVVALG